MALSSTDNTLLGTRNLIASPLWYIYSYIACAYTSNVHVSSGMKIHKGSFVDGDPLVLIYASQPHKCIVMCVYIVFDPGNIFNYRELYTPRADALIYVRLSAFQHTIYYIKSCGKLYICQLFFFKYIFKHKKAI